MSSIIITLPAALVLDEPGSCQEAKKPHAFYKREVLAYGLISLFVR
ncbi:hypothetical protein SAMN02745215_05162 [Desulfitobacterium chlororespirans DSM 11544]|uniref:Uncharacterized protein n=1 Tax=Desulfitobacterium chlororespirans DSM 11544 TaxID=1121395 RepID=A0A1M7UYW5_9FIRM|nr:hypothetical protein SAMN02745215_05162 [Desulfitobacterium chlororespirans DSM 11544]